MLKNIGKIILKISLLIVVLYGAFIPMDEYYEKMSGLNYYNIRGVTVNSKDVGIDLFLFILVISLYIIGFYKTIIMITNELQDTFTLIKFHCKNKLIYKLKTILFILKYIFIEWILLELLLSIVISSMYKTSLEELLYIIEDQVKLLLFVIGLSIIIVSYINSKLMSYIIVIVSMMFFILYNQKVNISIFLYSIIFIIATMIVEAIYKKGKYK